MVVANEGSFSAASRRLNRSQAAISYAIANLETQLDLVLFDRSQRRPTLTESGRVVLAYARRIMLLEDELCASASNFKSGLESSISLSIDIFFPYDVLASVLGKVQERFPSTACNLFSQSRAEVVERVLAKETTFGVTGWDKGWPDEIEAYHIGTVRLVAVAGPAHPLVQPGELGLVSLVRQHIQLVFFLPGSGESQDQRIGVSSARPWRVDNTTAALALLREGLGWAYVPLHLVEDDLSRGTLKRVPLTARAEIELPFTLIHRSDASLGVASRWIFEELTRGLLAQHMAGALEDAT